MIVISPKIVKLGEGRTRGEVAGLDGSGDDNGTERGQ